MPDKDNQRKSGGSNSGAVGRCPVPPRISLAKGGGAIRGIGETFAANPVTGTGSMTVLIATSPRRSGFGPQLALSYDSGTGNGPFGLGWNLSLSALTRRTDKGLPKYNDAEESAMIRPRIFPHQTPVSGIAISAALSAVSPHHQSHPGRRLTYG